MNLLRALRRQLAVLASMVSAPVTTLVRIARGDADAKPYWPIILHLVVIALVELKVLARYGMLAGYGGETMMHRVQETFAEHLRTDSLLLVITVVVAAIATRVLSKGQAHPWDGAVAGVFLLVPLTLEKALGGALADVGVTPIWWLPHLPVDSPNAILGREGIDWTRFAIKCVITYTAPLVIGLWFLFKLWRTSSLAPSDGASAMPTLTPMRLRAGAIGLAAIAVLFAGAATYDVVRLADRVRPLLPGDALPDVTLRKISDKGVSKEKVAVAASAQGKVLVVDFWASWCNPCRRSMPELSQIYDELAPQGLAVLAINREPQDPKSAAAAFDKIHPSFPSLIDDRFYGEKLGLTTLPTSYIVDRKGIVRHLHMGYTEPAIVRAEIAALLAEGGAP
jgi:thiol-disulfide isomerase/thioredoxin